MTFCVQYGALKVVKAAELVEHALLCSLLALSFAYVPIWV